MTESTNESRLKKYERPIAVCSGAIIGLIIASLPFIFWPNAPTALVWAAVAVGLVGGIAIGIKFPKIADGA